MEPLEVAKDRLHSAHTNRSGPGMRNTFPTFPVSLDHTTAKESIAGCLDGRCAEYMVSRRPVLYTLELERRNFDQR